MKKAIINGNIITETELLKGYNLYIEGGKITAIQKNLGNPVYADRVIDAKGNYVSAGFIDLHSHGGGGYDFMDGTAVAIIRACKMHLSHGTTSICPTTLTSHNEELFKFFNCNKSVKSSMRDGPNLLGIHLEGPYFAHNQRGAQDPRYLKSPTADDYNGILARSNDIIRFSLAPELDGAHELAQELKRRNILPAIAHSDAVYSEVLEAYKNGFTHVTHLYSGMSGLRRINAYRHLGVVESAYMIDDMTVEIIADGKHLPAELLKFILKFKPMDKISLVTDSMRGAGFNDGQAVILGNKKTGQVCVVEDGVAFLPDKSSFAGSVCTADRCVRTMYKLADCSIIDAVKMITVNPAKILGIENTKGKIEVGYDADICVFDDNINIHKVLVGGKLRVDNLAIQ